MSRKTRGGSLTRLVLALSLAGLSGWASAQAAGQGPSDGSASGNPGRGFTFQPTISINSTLTDNLNLTPTNRDTALVTSVAPGITINSDTGRVRGSLNYSLVGQLYEKTDEPSRFLNQLSAHGTADLIEGLFYLDGQANISQQQISAFGPQSADPSVSQTNSTEFGSLTLTPYMRGTLANLVTYDLRVSETENRAKGTGGLGDSHSESGAMNLQGANDEHRLLNWTLAVQTQRSDQSLYRVIETDSATAGLRYRPDPDLILSLNGGGERSNLLATNLQGSPTYGFTAAWTPTVRTQLNANFQSHDYGDSHTFSFVHRTAQTVWQYTDTQSVNTGGQQGNSGGQTLYDLVYLSLTSQFPDPTDRAAAVTSYLQSRGWNGNQLATSGFLSSGESLTHQQTGSFALQGQRTTLAVTVSRSHSQVISGQGTGVSVGDFAQANTIDTRGGSVSLSRAMTPTSSLSLNLADSRSGSDQLIGANTIKTALLNWTGQLSRHTQFVAGVRHTMSSGSFGGYRENAMMASLSQQF